MSSKDKYHQTQYLKLSLMGTLIFFIFLFYFFPEFEFNFTKKHQVLEVTIYLEDVPITIQHPLKKRPPGRLTSLGIPVPVEEEDFPEEVTLDTLRGPEYAEYGGKFAVVEIPAKPILETYPEVDNLKCNGEVKLLLLINQEGRVVQTEIIENSTGNPECARRAEEAALKSRWVPAYFHNKPVESWVVKIYRFYTK